ncbi:hypothetical protein V6N13_054781 [Hibiscus sabdariffa]|uniref:Protein kinase domain-containing protein n=1 Tax=Hibiscus sabdariffa TaxID=183260 RepID=A0ABR2DWR2_9ROSI
MFKLIFGTVRVREQIEIKDSGPSIFSPLIKKAGDLAFLEADDSLDSLEIIGRGACGEVYKAELPGSGGKIIAIKKVIQPPRHAAELIDEDSKLLNMATRQIRAEITTVGLIRPAEWWGCSGVELDRRWRSPLGFVALSCLDVCYLHQSTRRHVLEAE